jgi:hypothetical protein
MAQTHEQILQEQAEQLAPKLFEACAINGGIGMLGAFWTKSFAELPEKGQQAWISTAKDVIVAASLWASKVDRVAPEVQLVVRAVEEERR